MAKLHEEILVIKISKLLRDSEDASQLLTDELVASLSEVVQQLAGTDVLVETQLA